MEEVVCPNCGSEDYFMHLSCYVCDECGTYYDDDGEEVYDDDFE